MGTWKDLPALGPALVVQVQDRGWELTCKSTDRGTARGENRALKVPFGKA